MLHIFPPIAHVTFNFILLLSGMYFWCLPVLPVLLLLLLLVVVVVHSQPSEWCLSSSDIAARRTTASSIYCIALVAAAGGDDDATGVPHIPANHEQTLQFSRKKSPL